MKKLILSVLILLSFMLHVYAAGDEYQLVDLTNQDLIVSFRLYEEAFSHLGEHTGIVYQGKLIAMDEGVVVVNHDSCKVNVNTITEKTGENGYINGCYGNDGLYLKTSSSGEWILMLMSGSRSWVHRDDVTLVPYDSSLKLSSYFVEDDELYHQIRTQWNQDEFGSVVNLGKAPFELKENTVYFSYDGHSFYTDFSRLSKDMKLETDEHALNAGNPYYNYFMFLPHRSLSSYDSSDFRYYFESLGLNKPLNSYEDHNSDSIHDSLTHSQLVDSMDSFVYAQAEYGSNALLMLSLSMNESASGRSSLAYRRNNLFGHSAFDSDVEGNAKRYLSTENSVLSHAKNYISLLYANPDKFAYHGSFFGNKNSGMNVSYASDPYWSEKAASYAYHLDLSLAQNDYNRYALAIVKDEEKIMLYDKDMNKVISVAEHLPLMSFVILSETDEAYGVWMDEAAVSLSSVGSYDFSQNIRYLKKSVVDTVLNPENIKSIQLVKTVFNALEGSFKDGSKTKVLQFEPGREAVCEAPVMDHAVFDHWKQISETEYEAVYRQISMIKMHALPDQVTELNVPLSLKNGMIEVFYEDGTSEIVELTTSMISGYSLSEAGDHNVLVSYGGASASYPLHVSIELDEARRKIDELIEAALSSESSMNEKLEAAINAKALMLEQFYPVLTMNEVIQLDVLLKEKLADSVSMIIEENDVNLSLSGLFLSKQFSESASFLKPTVKISFLQSESDLHAEKILKAQGWKVEKTYELSFKINDVSETWEGPMLFTIDRPDQELKKWMMVYVSQDDAIECHTAVYQDRIRFKAFHPGKYILVSKDSVNSSHSAALEDTLTVKDNGFDTVFLFKAGCTVFIFVLIFLFFKFRNRLK